MLRRGGSRLRWRGLRAPAFPRQSASACWSGLGVLPHTPGEVSVQEPARTAPARRLNDGQSRAENDTPTRIDFPSTDASQPIVVAADSADRWTRGAYEVWAMRGNCVVQQGSDVVRGQEAVVWLRRSVPTESRRSLVIVYMEGDVVLHVAQKGPPARLTDQSWLGRWETVAGVQVRVPEVHGAPEPLPPIYARAVAARDGGITSTVQQAQYTQPIGPAATAIGPPPPGLAAGTPPPGSVAGAAPPGSAVVAPPPPAGPGADSVRAVARRPAGRVGFGPSHAARGRSPSPGTPTATPTWIGVIEGGVNLIIEDVPVPGNGRLNRTLQIPSLASIGIGPIGWSSGPVGWRSPGSTAAAPSRPRRRSRSTWRGTSFSVRASG